MTGGQDDDTKRATREQLAALLAHSCEVVLVLDHGLWITWVSPSASGWATVPAWNPGADFLDIPIEADRDLLRAALGRIDPSDPVEFASRPTAANDPSSFACRALSGSTAERSSSMPAT